MRHNLVLCRIRSKTGTTSGFALKRGVRQGRPISPYLFSLCTQILASHISNSPLKGISIAEKEIVISQLADDTTIFLKKSNQVPIALKVIDDFSKASGLILNLNKCQLLPIRNCNENSIGSITVHNEVTDLGVIINKDEKNRSSSNFASIIKKLNPNQTNGDKET